VAEFVRAVKRIARKASADQITTQAAAIAYAFFLALFPLIFSLFALTGIIGGDRAFHEIMSSIERAVPPETAKILAGYVAQITNHSRPAILSVGVVTMLWSAAGGVGAILGGLNNVYEVRETRGVWKPRALALGVMIICALLFIAAAVAILVGPGLAKAFHMGVAWEILRWPIGYLLVTLVFWILYYLLPARDQSRSKKAILVGAAAGAFLWIVITFLFQLYVSNFGSFDLTYGALGAVVVLLVWLYLSALAILLGGEIAQAAEREGWVR
jgi:membrane protein